MIVLFYFFGCIAILSTIYAIFNKNPIHALLCLILLLLSTSCIFFILKAYFVGAIEIIIYAGSIMVLFLFVIMTIGISNVSTRLDYTVHDFIPIKFFLGMLFLMIDLLIVLLFSISKTKNSFIKIEELIIPIKQVAITLFDTYILVVEIASLLLLGALVTVLHITQGDLVCVNDSVSYNKNKKR